MKQLYKLISFLALSLLLIVQSNEAQASHAMGADLTYECIGPNQYLLTYSFYRDCDGITPSGSYTLNYSSASCSRTGTISLTLLAGYPVEVSPLCQSQIINSTCNGGTQPGIQQWIYSGVVTLPQA